MNIIVVFKILVEVTTKIVFCMDLMLCALVCNSVRRNVLNEDSPYLHNFSKCTCLRSCHMPEETQVLNFV
jgi:hypothetical protein